MKVHQGLEKIFHIYKWYDESKASMAKIALNKYLQENKTFKFWTFLSFSVLLLLFSHSVTSRSLKPHGLQHVRLSCPSLYPSLLRLMLIELVMPSNHLILCCLPLLFPSIFTNIRGLFHLSWLLSHGQSTGASALASVLPMNIQGWFPLGLTFDFKSKRISFWSPCCPQDSQESPPAPQSLFSVFTIFLGFSVFSDNVLK